jgi:hypothetical protein
MYSFLLLAALNIDNYNYIGHILPLKHERLSTPHKSSCGLITYEWRGSSPSFDLVDKFCLLAKNKFPAFVKSKGYEVRNKDFRYRGDGQERACWISRTLARLSKVGAAHIRGGCQGYSQRRWETNLY